MTLLRHPTTDRVALSATRAEILESRLELETLLSDLSSRFINLPPGEVDREIEDALRRVCELLGLDLAVLWQWSDAVLGVITPTHVYHAQPGLRPTEPMRQEHYPWSREQVLAGRVIAMSSPEDLPAEAAVDRQTCRRFGIQSALCLPLLVGGESPIGALGFNTLREQRDWPNALVKWLQLVAQVFTNALARKRNELDLRESEARLSLAADSAEAGLWILDGRTRTFWATQRARAIFGYASDEVIDMERLQASVHADDWDPVQDAIERSLHEHEPMNLECRILLGDDSVRWIASRARPQFSPAGEPDRLMGISIDITERRRAQEALRTSEARLAAGADLAGLGFYEVDFDQVVMYSDERVRDLCGIPPDRTQGLQALELWLEHLHPDDRHRMLHLREQLHDGRLERLSCEYRYQHPARGEQWFQHLAGVSARDAGGRAIRTFGVLRDITEHKRAEEELRDLGRRLIRAHEDERALLARELHDDLTQRLAVLAIDVGRVERATPDAAQARALSAVREGLVRLSEDVHTLAYQLHPSVLEELGLAEALRAECERVGRKLRIQLSVEPDSLPGTIEKEAALCLFRVAQESLNNVARHAGAASASVTLRAMDAGLLLVVRDDGVGFDPRQPGRGKSLGLASMRERVRLLNGTLDIESAPGQGTSISAWVPAQGASR